MEIGNWTFSVFDFAKFESTESVISIEQRKTFTPRLILTALFLSHGQPEIDEYPQVATFEGLAKHAFNK